MAEEVVKSSLLAGELEGAAQLCLASAAMTSDDRFPPGSGEYVRREHHARKRRFEHAKSLIESGVTDVLELGLSHDDLGWAASRAHLARDKEGWRARFQKAELELRERFQQQLEQLKSEEPEPVQI
jgi:hypothetical protein